MLRRTPACSLINHLHDWAPTARNRCEYLTDIWQGRRPLEGQQMSESNVIRLPVREREPQTTQPPGRLTIEQIMAAEPPALGSPHRYLFCPEQKGFGVCITARGVRTYFVQARSNGKVQRRTLDLVGAISFNEAKKRARQLRASATLNGQDISKRVEVEAAKPKPVLTLAAAWEQYQKARKLAPNTLRIYRAAFARLASWRERDLWTISKDDVSKRFDEVLEKHKAGSAKQTFVFLRAVWTYHAASLPVEPTCPTSVLKQQRKWPKIDRRTRLIDADTFPQWWRSVETEGSAWALYFRALALTGCRRTEMLRSEWKDYDAKRREWHFPAHITKNRHAHTAPVGPKLAAMLAAHRKTQEGGVAFIFATPSGRSPMWAPHHPIERLCKAHGYKWSSHDLRRTYLTVGAALNVPRSHLKALVNHISGDVTDGYIHPERLREDQERIEAAILKRAKVRS